MMQLGADRRGSTTTSDERKMASDESSPTMIGDVEFRQATYENSCSCTANRAAEDESQRGGIKGRSCSSSSHQHQTTPLVGPDRIAPRAAATAIVAYPAGIDRTVRRAPCATVRSAEFRAYVCRRNRQRRVRHRRCRRAADHHRREDRAQQRASKPTVFPHVRTSCRGGPPLRARSNLRHTVLARQPSAAVQLLSSQDHLEVGRLACVVSGRVEFKSAVRLKRKSC